MGRDNHNSKRSKNKKDLSMTPKRDIATDDSDLEIAKELTDMYNYEVKPGFVPTGVERKKK